VCVCACVERKKENSARQTVPSSRALPPALLPVCVCVYVCPCVSVSLCVRACVCPLRSSVGTLKVQVVAYRAREKKNAKKRREEEKILGGVGNLQRHRARGGYSVCRMCSLTVECVLLL